ncbi:ribonuclease P/MRP protein subunit POP1 [[Emmonsia] crescens]|uniref:Ribonuclease P/MRP protein subunit POP1 n=1 Tax=[Emmonsia] crescens TaxID=73230 RepID=A0A2B7Z828_9EURO|nr:ribonuclease P/MRP protein subunit POP1 [Emmonsia crescens]
MGPKPARATSSSTRTTTTKRKTPASDPSARKRARTYDARTLAVQSSDAALSKTGELDVSAFVAAREFEIRALEAGIRNSKAALASRAFQKVPRNLRRRTASHNVKRVPSRLRARARREMIEDNTPTVTARRRKPTKLLRLRLETARRLQNLNSRSKARRAAKKASASSQGPASEKGDGKGTEKKATHDVNIAPRVPKIKKNRLSHPEKPQSKFKKRQRCKTWLPTHMFHAKRAHMTSPKEPLWRFVVPLSPTEKSYRPTHRASGARGAVAWDMSYISTIGLEGVEASLEGLFRGLGVVSGEEAWGNKGRKWRAGTRSLEVWLFEREGEGGGKGRPIAPVTLVWCVEKTDGDGDVEMVDAGAKPKKRRRKMFLRVHPSAFLQVWEELLKAAKLQSPQVMVEDLRFDIGSIDITGPGATETLLAALEPIPPSDGKKWPEGSPEATWGLLAGLTNAASLPQNALLAFNIADPRLHHPPRTIKPPTSEPYSNELAVLLSSWSPDSTQLKPDIFSRPARLTASRLLPSQKAINRRKSMANPGEYPSPKPTDPHIPVLILASRPKSLSKGGNSQGTYTVLLPWKCVVPVWYSIMYYPMSSGGNPRFGGLLEKQQLAFECGEPWFPGDYPGTNAGWAWEMREREIRRREWERKPTQKRVAYDSIDLGGAKKGEIGQGWACDWERLIQSSTPKSEEVQAKPEDSTSVVEKEEQTKTAEKSNQQEASEGERKKKDKQLKDKSTSSTTTYSYSHTKPTPPPLHIHHLPPSTAFTILKIRTTQKSPTNLPTFLQSLLAHPTLATVNLTLINRGTPTPRARLYRLPTTNPSLRNEWLALLSPSAPTPSAQKQSKQKQRQAMVVQTSSKLLPTNLSADPEPAAHLPMPGEEDLIGFVTTGNYNLAAGRGTGIASVLVDRVRVYDGPGFGDLGDSSSSGESGGSARVNGGRGGMSREKLARVCIVRSAGERVGRLGVWEVA